MDSLARTIEAKFQFPLSNNELVDLYFSVIDPRNSASDGFLYNPGVSTSSVIYNVIRIQKHGGTTYSI